jgi:hypothetical protein
MLTKAELLTKLAECATNYDCEEGHVIADGLLLDYIGDAEIKDAFDSIEKWYS